MQKKSPSINRRERSNQNIMSSLRGGGVEGQSKHSGFIEGGVEGQHQNGTVAGVSERDNRNERKARHSGDRRGIPPAAARHQVSRRAAAEVCGTSRGGAHKVSRPPPRALPEPSEPEGNSDKP